MKLPIGTYYIAGPMSGYPSFNHPAFFAKEKEILAHAPPPTFVLNPAKIANGDTTKEYAFYIKESLALLEKANAVVFLEGWKNSKGARLEAAYAIALGLDMYDHEFNPLEMKIDQFSDDQIDSLVEERQSQYGHPFTNFTQVGRIWGAILGIKDIDPEKIALMMVGLKISRENFHHLDDNIKDGAGYFKTINTIRKHKEKMVLSVVSNKPLEEM
jgi:hypothetical protein